MRRSWLIAFIISVSPLSLGNSALLAQRVDYDRDARRWASATIDRLVSAYDLDWIKIDCNIDIGDRFDPAPGDRAGRRLADHVTSYYAWLDSVRAAHPDLIIENCSSGGLHFDMGVMAHAHTSWLSDFVDPKASVELGYGCTLQFVPEICNHWMVGDTDKGEVKEASATGWAALQYVAPGGRRSVLLAYRLARGVQLRGFRLRGLLPNVVYRVVRDGAPVRRVTGADLARAGLRVTLDAEWRSSVVEIEAER